mmetsp:Transcript_23192/g.41900  ORF Transcript_23192/g.41900 Transcript_23192/m.41900 type:complete len:469 (+) Transcript_23192:78-1484(+)
MTYECIFLLIGLASAELPVDFGSFDSCPVHLLQVEAAARSKGKAGQPYFWPSARGAGHGASEFVAPFDLAASLNWSWENSLGRFASSPTGVVIDDKKNIYMTELSALRKFSHSGEELWSYGRQSRSVEMNNAACLLDGVAYLITSDGLVHAVSMESGKPLWVKAAGNGTDPTNSFVSAKAGRVIVGTDPNSKSNSHVAALNATNGDVLWKYQPDKTVWNFLATFPNDNSVVFQDLEGKAYNVNLTDGALNWKAGGIPNSWTDGSAQLGPNGVVYAVSHNGSQPLEGGTGTLSAYNATTGVLLWRKITPKPPNNVPAVGRLAGKRDLSVVQAVGQQDKQYEFLDVYAYDALTGEQQWVFNGPMLSTQLPAGDEAGYLTRMSVGLRVLTLPNGWSAPSIDGDGTVFIGNEEGWLFAIRDVDDDGLITGNEVSSFQTNASFVGTSAPAIADGMLVAATNGPMFVFKTPSSS